MIRVLTFCFFIVKVSSFYQNDSKSLKNRIKRSDFDECGVPFEGSDVIDSNGYIKSGSFPWLVAVYMLESSESASFRCPGVIISSTKIISSAHCVLDKGQEGGIVPRNFFVFFGAHDLGKKFENGRSTHALSKILLDSEWSEVNYNNYKGDIALLTLREEIGFTDIVRPVCFSSGIDNIIFPAGEVVGWRRNFDASTEKQYIARKINVPIISNLKCYRGNTELAAVSWDKSFCAGRPASVDCSSDSESVLFVKVNNRYYIKGIYSVSLKDDNVCNQNNYAVYTDVVKYAEFIALKPQQQKTTQRPVIQTNPPVYATAPPVFATAPPIYATNPPIVFTEAPAVYTNQPYVVTGAPVIQQTSRQPQKLTCTTVECQYEALFKNMLTETVELYNALAKSGRFYTSESFALALKIKKAMQTNGVPAKILGSFQTLKNKLPASVRKIIWSENVYILNKFYPGENLYAANEFLAFDSLRRSVFTWVPGDRTPDSVFRFSTSDGKIFVLINVNTNECLYVDGTTYNNNFRHVFTLRDRTINNNCFWNVDILSNNEIRLKSAVYKEYLFAGGDQNKLTPTRRYAYTYIKRTANADAVWIVE